MFIGAALGLVLAAGAVVAPPAAAHRIRRGSAAATSTGATVDGELVSIHRRCAEGGRDDHGQSCRPRRAGDQIILQASFNGFNIIFAEEPAATGVHLHCRGSTGSYNLRLVVRSGRNRPSSITCSFTSKCSLDHGDADSGPDDTYGPVKPGKGGGKGKG